MLGHFTKIVGVACDVRKNDVTLDTRRIIRMKVSDFMILFSVED